MKLKEKDKIISITETFNTDQTVAFGKLIEFMEDENKTMFTVAGYAGTGKTYMIGRFISSYEKIKVAMTAPTNKATKVLSSNRTKELEDASYLTIHKLLGLRLKWMFPPKDAKWKPYQKLVKAYGKPSQLSEFDVLIVDEVSMLTDELFSLIKEEAEFHNKKVIFLGDPAQIPPVRNSKEDKDLSIESIPLDEAKRKEYNIGYTELKQIMRQADGSSIAEIAYGIRQQRFKDSERFDVMPNRVSSNDAFFDDASNNIFLEEMFKDFGSYEFQLRPDFAKVLAYRNKTVRVFNETVRGYLFKDKDIKYLMPSEKLIADTPIFRDDVIIYNTSDEFTVLEYSPQIFTYNPDKEANEKDFGNLLGEASGYKLRYYKTVILNSLNVEDTVDILHPEDYEKLKKIIGIAFKKKQFDDYEMLQNRFAKVSYNYAITVHKAQGSTYDNVYLIEDDIRFLWRSLEMHRILYTAVTRASKKLRILSRRNK